MLVIARNGFAIAADEGGDRGATAFEAERGNGDDKFSFVHQRLSENACSDDSPLASSPMQADFIHEAASELLALRHQIHSEPPASVVH